MVDLKTIIKMLLRRMRILQFVKRDRGTGRIAHCGSEFEVHSSDISEFIVEKLIPIVGVRPYSLESE